MASNPVALVPEVHKGLKVKQKGNAEHIKENHIAKVYLPEFVKAGTDYPIVFMKDHNTGDFFAVVIWGFEPKQNLFIEDNNWVGGFLPASVRCYPFTMSANPDEPGRLFIGLFEDSTLLNKEEGELIFNDNGTETEWMTNTKNFLVSVYEQEELSKKMLNDLNNQGLFAPQALTFQFPDEEKEQKVDGFFVIDKDKLAALSDKDFLEMRKSNILEPIYAHMASLDNLNKLLKRRNDLHS